MPTKTETPSVTSTPPFDLHNYVNSWQRFQGAYGISFEYPSIYAEPPFQNLCRPIDSRDGVDFGANSRVFVRQQQGSSLSEHVQLFISEYYLSRQFKLESQVSTLVNELPAITLDYTLDGVSLKRTFTFIEYAKDKLVFTFSFSDGKACDIPEIEIYEMNVYQRAIKTFLIER